MTYREMYTNVINGTIDEETVEMAKTAIAKLDERNAKRASKPSKTAVANEPIKASILEFLADGEAHLAKEIGEAVGITTAKASSLCGKLAQEEKVVASKVKLPKIGERYTYTLAQSRGKGREISLFFLPKVRLLINKRARPARFRTLKYGSKKFLKKGVDKFQVMGYNKV